MKRNFLLKLKIDYLVNIISNSFLLCTHTNSNSIIKINENAELSNYFMINSPIEEEN